MVCDHAPTALIAARSLGVKSVAIGTGFEIPPTQIPHPPFNDRGGLSSDAQRDIAGLLNYLVPEAGEAVARAYVARLHAFLRSVDTFPKRGTVRSDFRLGLRVVGFERSASVAFVVEDDRVVILRIFQRGQDLTLDDV